MRDARCTTPTHDTHPTARRANRHLLTPADALRSARARSPPSTNQRPHDSRTPMQHWRRCSDPYDFAHMRTGIDDDARRAHGLARKGMTPRCEMPKLIPFSEVGIWRATREHNGWRSEGNAHSAWPRVSDASRRLRGYTLMSLAVRIVIGARPTSGTHTSKNSSMDYACGEPGCTVLGICSSIPRPVIKYHPNALSQRAGRVWFDSQPPKSRPLYKCNCDEVSSQRFFAPRVLAGLCKISYRSTPFPFTEI
ncbi:hypothetical protein B0H11DRAFT_2276313 [Mycena galericulata]|nr:hypothetical protein B0H11DRAFT_2276313 [Mycena galericulata]